MMKRTDAVIKHLFDTGNKMKALALLKKSQKFRNYMK